MVFFLMFKNNETYSLYRKKALQDWESMIWKIGILLWLLEGGRTIEDVYHKPYNIWSMLWKVKALNFGYYALITWVRLLIVKILPKYKQAFLNVTDLIIIAMLVIILKEGSKLPDPGSYDYNAVWLGKEFLRQYAETFCLLFAFYNWFVPFLYMGAYFAYILYLYITLLPTISKGIYMPTYVMTWFCLVLLCFALEHMRRSNFEKNHEMHVKERVYKEILNEFPEGTLIISKKKEILYINPAFYSILNMNFQSGLQELDELSDMQDISIEGYSLETSTFDNGVPITKFRDLQDQIWSQWSSHVDYFSSVKHHEEYKMFKGTYQIDETRSKTIEIKFSLRKFGGQDVALFIFSDVSERLQITYLRQSIEYKNRLLASVSHELRTPLNGNINFIQAAVNDPSVPNNIKQTRLVPALRSARYLLILINDILDFSQIQAQSLRLVPVCKNIVETVKEAMELVEIQAQRKGLSLKLNLAHPTYQQEFKTDHNRVLQIIANLLSNALKFTFKGGITVTIRPESNRVVCIEVEDSGMGIKKEDQPKLFKAFGKLDLGGKNHMNSQGVGLGLVISNSLACMLGPQVPALDPEKVLEEEEEQLGISFESEYGRGTKFWFRIVDQDDMKSNSHCGNVASEGNKNDLPEFTTTNANVPLLGSPNDQCQCPEYLIADDDAFNILTLESMLASMGMSSECAYNGQQVLEMIKKRINNPCSDSCQSYKMIFLDCNMPIMDGYDCMARLKSFFEKHPEHECAVIACTAATNQAEKDRAIECGMRDFVTKPINKKRIQDLLNLYCAKANSSSASEKYAALTS